MLVKKPLRSWEWQKDIFSVNYDLLSLKEKKLEHFSSVFEFSEIFGFENRSPLYP
jgi:hypothetical protein